MMAALWIFLDDIARMLGAGKGCLELTKDYLRITVGCGIFSMISNCFSCVVRSEGQTMKAMTGTLIGNLLNMILDPVFILAFGWGVEGAAIATVIGNAVAALYYIMYFVKGRSALSIHPKYFSVKEKILSGVLGVGISASLANLMSSVSSILVNTQLAGYDNGELLVAGYGVTAKVIMIVTLIGIGSGSGVQPFLGYCYGAKEKQRLQGGIRFSALLGLGLCAIIAGLCYLLAKPIVNISLTDPVSVEAGILYTRILMSTAWLIGAFCLFQNALQAMGAAADALLSVLFRQCLIFIPALFILKALMGVNGLIWAQPAADVLSLAVILFMLQRRIKKTDFSKANGTDDVNDSLAGRADS